MRLGRLDLNLLVALDVLIGERSVTGAAKRLNLSQPAMTGALNRLRVYFGDELLVQSGREMLLTPKAIELLPPVREALSLIRSRITPSREFDPATAERNFSIVASDFVYHVLLAPALAAAAASAPGVTFDIYPTDRQTIDRVTRGEVDLLITLDSYVSATMPRRPMFEDEHAVICWAEGCYGGGVGLDAFHDARHAVVYFGAERLPAFTETLLERLGVARRIAIRVPNFSGLPAAVIGTNRIATMYRSHAEHFARGLPINVLPMPFAMPRVVETAQWHSMHDHDEGLKWLLALLERHAPPGLGKAELPGQNSRPLVRAQPALLM